MAVKGAEVSLRQGSEPLGLQYVYRPTSQPLSPVNPPFLAGAASSQEFLFIVATHSILILVSRCHTVL